MDRNQRSRRQKAAATPSANRRPAPRSMKSRLGLTKKGQPSRQTTPSGKQPSAGQPRTATPQGTPGTR